MSENAIEFLREHFKIDRKYTINVEFVKHDLKNFAVFNVMTGGVDIVEMQKFWNGITQSYFYAGYHAGNGRIYIRDATLDDIDFKE